MQQRRRQKESAWLIAALQRTKKLPDLSRFAGDEPQPKAAPKQQTWQEMKAALKVITGHA